MSSSKACNLGFPRIGKLRELKFALEKCWNGETDEEYPFGQLHTFARFRAVLKCRDEHERIGCSEAEAEPDGSRTSGL